MLEGRTIKTSCLYEARKKVEQLKKNGYVVDVEKRIYCTEDFDCELGTDYVINILFKRE